MLKKSDYSHLRPVSSVTNTFHILILPVLSAEYIFCPSSSLKQRELTWPKCPSISCTSCRQRIQLHYLLCCQKCTSTSQKTQRNTAISVFMIHLTIKLKHKSITSNCQKSPEIKGWYQEKIDVTSNQKPKRWSLLDFIHCNSVKVIANTNDIHQSGNSVDNSNQIALIFREKQI